jgi:hypothetical protein
VSEHTAQTKDTMLTIPMETRHAQVLGIAARRVQRSVSGYVRWMILNDLKDQGLLDENYDVLEEAS